VTARKAYLRASEYWRQYRSAFRAALPLFDCHAVATRSRSTASP
jgi:hypothetical protein